MSPCNELLLTILPVPMSADLPGGLCRFPEDASVVWAIASSIQSEHKARGAKGAVGRDKKLDRTILDV